MNGSRGTWSTHWHKLHLIPPPLCFVCMTTFLPFWHCDIMGQRSIIFMLNDHSRHAGALVFKSRLGSLQFVSKSNPSPIRSCGLQTGPTVKLLDQLSPHYFMALDMGTIKSYRGASDSHLAVRLLSISGVVGRSNANDSRRRGYYAPSPACRQLIVEDGGLWSCIGHTVSVSRS